MASFQSTHKSLLFGMQLFDAASRGPLGSLGILIRHRAQSLVCLGAAVIVLLLAFDPFMQQVISYPVRPINTSDGQAVAKQVRGIIPAATDWGHAFGLGLWSDESFHVSPTCSSGNCTWEEFSSVGFCSHCSEMTSLASLKCNLGNATTWSNQTCEITLPVGVGYKFSDTMENDSFGKPVNGLRFADTIIWTTHRGMKPTSGVFVGGLMDPNVAHAYAELTTSRQASLTAPLSNPISIRNLTVCAHSLCLSDYRVSVNNGKASIQTGNVDFGTRYLVGNSSMPYNTTYWAPGNKSKASFAFNEYDGDGGKNGGNVQYVDAVAQGFFPVEKKESVFLFQDNQWSNDSDNDFDPNPLFDRIRNIGIASVMSNIAASFTKMVLEKPNDTVNGTVQTSKVFVSVQWYWLILPAFLVVLGAIFFIGTTATNRKAKMSLWKSSALAPFYHGLEEIEGKEFKSSSTMETIAEREDVRLRYSEANGRFMLQKR